MPSLSMTCSCCGHEIKAEAKLSFVFASDEKTRLFGTNEGFGTVAGHSLLSTVVSDEFSEDLDVLFDPEEVEDVVLCSVSCLECESE